MIRSGDFCIKPHKSPEVHAVFERHTMKFSTRDHYVPVEPFTDVLFSFFFAGNLGSLRPKYQKEKEKMTEKCEKTKQNKTKHS